MDLLLKEIKFRNAEMNCIMLRVSGKKMLAVSMHKRSIRRPGKINPNAG